MEDGVAALGGAEGRKRSVAGRYRVLESIGRGGMADVFRVHDTVTERDLAMKKLRPVDAEHKRERSLELFEHEFHTLAQLSHPRVVQVSDYGIEGDDPYYVMELLDGGDLQERSPIEWRLACAIARDVCSVFSLLHSRRMLYRDMSPRNVRLTRDGQAKVIDFGAMVPMGVCKQVVGTPAFCAPEALYLQPLDARTDLYSLGATLYSMLTGRRAHPARDFRQLRELWGKTVRPPSELTPGIPSALDALVLDMLQLDPAARPASAGEVMERLGAIAELPQREELAVSAAYLATPTLLARGRELARFRKKLAGAQRGRGGAMLIRGASGAGRSRLLNASMLDAKLAGATVLRADAIDAQTGDYGVVRALARQLLDIWPEQAQKVAASLLSVLGHVVPELLENREPVALQAFEDADALRAALQPALRRWFGGVARMRPPLVLAIDDVHQIDEPSAAFAALMAYEAPGSSLLVLSTTTSDARVTSASLKLLFESSAAIGLDNLRAADTEDLLRSIFGDVPYVNRLAIKVHALSRGNPRDVMTLAQHLLDRGVVSYEAGVWSLPANVDARDLPSSMAQALNAQVEALSADARELAQAMALCADQSFSLEECAQLTAHRDPKQLHVSLDRLVQVEIVRIVGDRYDIAHESRLDPLRSTLAPELERELMLRLADVFERRGARMRAAQYLLQGGQDERGLDALIAASEQSQRETDQSTEAFAQLIRGLPVGWFECFEHAVRLCEALGRPRRQAHILRTRQTSLQTSLTDVTSMRSLIELVQDLSRMSGADLCAQLDPALGPQERLQRAFAGAQARYDAMSEHERVLEPRLAIAQLARTMITAGGVSAIKHDHLLLGALPSIEAYAALSPVLGVVGTLIRGIRARLTSRTESARADYAACIARLAQPDRGGLGASYHRHAHLGMIVALGLMEAQIGLPNSLALATSLESDQSYHVNAWQVRMIYHLWQGQVREAEHCQKQVELLKVQNSPRQWNEGGQLIGQVTAHAAAGDLMRVKQTIEPIEALAKHNVGWVPILYYARGEYQRLRGDFQGALAAFEGGLSLSSAGGHCIWGNLAAGVLHALNGLERADEACTRGREMLASAQQQGLGYVVNYLRMPLAIAEAKLGDTDAAVQTAQAAVDALLELGATGLNLGLAYETRARVASAARDQEGFERFASLCAAQYRASENRTLSARYDRLVEGARRAKIDVPVEVADAAGFTETGSAVASQVTGMMEGYRGSKERARRGLELLVRSSASSEGFMFMLVDRAPALQAQVSERELPNEIDRLARELLLGEIRLQTEDHTRTMAGPDDDVTRETQGTGGAWLGGDGYRYRPVLLNHATSTGFVTIGLAVLVEDAERPFVYPAQLATELSRYAYDSGDVSAVTANLSPRRDRS